MIGVTAAASPAYAFEINGSGSMGVWGMFFGFGYDVPSPERDLTGVIQGSGWGW